jgi:hypothetical protein
MIDYFFNIKRKEKNGIFLTLINSKVERDIAKNIVEKYHSYVPTFNSVGRRIDWLINYESKIIGMIGIGSSTYPPCKDILNHLNVNKSEYKEIFNNISNNWRFCLKESPIRNTGTISLKLMRDSAKVEWKEKYGDDLKYMITFVGGGNVGSVYLADNWKIIGKTAGLPKHKSISMKWNSNEELKKLFVKPDGKDRKLIFFKEIQ